MTISATTGTETQTQNGAVSSANNPTAALAGKEMFLKLLVAQIRNQNPMNPADGMEFLSELAQFSQLEQMMEMRSELQAIREELTAPVPEPEAGGDAATA
jgi:flagellar basal-body rod modification protein FlgD